MSDLLEDADEDTRGALASLAYELGEELYAQRATFTTRAAFRRAVRLACEAWAQSQGPAVIPQDRRALDVLYTVMRDALEDGFAEMLAELPEGP